MYPHLHYYIDEQYLLLHIMGIDKTQFCFTEQNTVLLQFGMSLLL